jgi:hypothetical protein
MLEMTGSLFSLFFLPIKNWVDEFIFLKALLYLFAYGTTCRRPWNNFVILLLLLSWQTKKLAIWSFWHFDGLEPRCYSTLLGATWVWRYLMLLNATRRYSTLLDATWRYSTLLDAAWRCSTLLDAARRCSTLLDAIWRYSYLKWVEDSGQNLEGNGF